MTSRFGRLQGQADGRQHVRYEIDPQKLDLREGFPETDSGAGEHEQDLARIGTEDVLNRIPDIAVGRPATLNLLADCLLSRSGRRSA
jgi:hypothetical protein